MELKIINPKKLLRRDKVTFLRKNGERITVLLKEIDEVLEFCENSEKHEVYMHKIPKTGHSREIDIVMRSPKKLTQEECKEFNLLKYDPEHTNPLFVVIPLLPFLKYYSYVVNEDWLHMERHIGPGNSMSGPISRMEAFKTVLCCYEHNKTENNPLMSIAK